MTRLPRIERLDLRTHEVKLEQRRREKIEHNRAVVADWIARQAWMEWEKISWDFFPRYPGQRETRVRWWMA